MIENQRVVCVIPARLLSSRFPRKILAPLQGKPLLQWVWEAASRQPLFDEVVIAIDSEETAEAIRKFHGRYLMTSPECTSGTERLVELFRRGKLGADIWLNWQADEPLFSQHAIEDLLLRAAYDPSDVWTLSTPIAANEADSPHNVKVVVDVHDEALYFSRSPIPYVRQPDRMQLLKHLGIYAYSKEGLQKIAMLPKSCALEEVEGLEQLRFLYYGLKIKVYKTSHVSVGVDLPEHLDQVEKILTLNRR